MHWILLLTIFISAIPDTIVVAVTKDLFMDRYGVSAPAAQMFLAVNLPGAILAVPLLARLRRSVDPLKLLAVASLLDAILLLCMWPGVGFEATLALRAAEGVTDVIVFAILFDLLRAGSGAAKGVGLGAGSTALTLGLATGVIIGGLAAHGAGATVVFPIAASACAVVALIALWKGGSVLLDQSPVVARCPAAVAPIASANSVPGSHLWQAWPALAMAFVDRSTGGLMTAVLPLVLGSYFGYSTSERGWLIGLPLALMALGATPAGLLVDRFSGRKVRLWSGVAYAGALATVPFVAGEPSLLAGFLVIVGLAGAALLSSNLVLVARCSEGSVAMGGFRAAGDLGYFAGCGFSAALAAALGGSVPSLSSYLVIIVTFAVAHLSTNLIALRSMRESG